jgi:DnaK suppressor protein
MDPDRARHLLELERLRIERAIANLGTKAPEGSLARSEPGDRDSEELYQDEFDAGQAEHLDEQLAAVERAEARLVAGTYGLSVESGRPIPDARLEVVPTAERTLEEQRLVERGPL